jgi:hypothetical protein
MPDGALHEARAGSHELPLEPGPSGRELASGPGRARNNRRLPR